ncbi:MAG TPA: type IV pilus biogenesis/stability protein PilW [Dongiaceae bacterium]|nr:type IV pilus biogenesis/stability protein PilW [Dongiaceae bacterium]
MTRLLIAVGLALVLAGCVTESDSRLEQNKNPEKATRAYVEAGMTYMQRNQMDNAHRTLMRAVELSPDDPAVNNAVALFFQKEGDHAQTEKFFKRALSKDPEFSQARNNYAAYLFSRGEYEKAIEQLERVTKDYRYDKRFAAFENLGLCYLKTGNVEKALESFNRALKLNNSLPVSILEVAEIKFNQGDNALSLDYLSRYEKLSKPSPRQLWLGIRLQRVLGDKNKLASYELQLRNMFPGSPEYQAYKASLQS